MEGASCSQARLVCFLLRFNHSLPNIFMKITFKKLAVMAALSLTTGSAQASLAGFTDFGYTGGTTASWDIFYGPNRVKNFSFETGTAGNPDDSAKPFLLNANVPGWVSNVPFSKATGPIDTDGITIPGNRELFYTFFATTVKFTIYGLVTGTEMDDFAFQTLVAPGSGGAITNVQLNGMDAEVEDVNENDVNYWTWSSLNLAQGSTFQLTFEANTIHSAFDAFQIQTSTEAIPEPSTYALMALGLIVVLYRARKRMA